MLLSLYQHASAIEAGRRAVELNANYHLAHFVLGIALTFGGAPVEALGPLESAVRLSPCDPAAWFMHATRALAHYTARQYQAANSVNDKALLERPGYGGAMMSKVAALVRLGRTSEGRELLAEVPSIAFQQLPFLCPFQSSADFEHFLTALEQGGLSPMICEDGRRVFADLQFG